MDDKPVILRMWLYKGVRLETPSDMTHETWETLVRFLEVIEPDKKNPPPEAAQPQSDGTPT